jgi:eukaryotic-like serine/threonine-protein kinase
MPEPKFDDLPKGTTVQGWTIEGRINSGKSAMVYQATKEGEAYALKVYDPRVYEGGAKKAEVERLERQKTTIGRHNHPNLVKIYDAGECRETGFLYVVMELFDGWENLSQPRVPQHRVPAILAQIADAAHFLETEFHSVHRDIKPANVVIAPDSTRAVLLDLGVVKPLAGDSPGTLEFIDQRPFLGTKRYSPLEFLEGELKEGDTPGWRAVTFYQIGAVLYELLTAKQFYGNFGDNEMHLVQAAKKKGPPELPASVQSPMRELLTRCLDPDPRKRIDFDDEAGVDDWARFQLERNVRRPTVVLLYTGGTFGSERSEPKTPGGPRERQLRRIQSRGHDDLAKLRDRMAADFNKVYAPIDGIPFDLQWEILDPDEQLLSENATVKTWNALTAAIERIVHKYCVLPTHPGELDAALALHPALFEDADGQGADGWTPAAKERLIADLKSRYLAGIIVFHGTDTMAYSANAIAFGTHDLPCPIILTGANNPPSAELVTERSILTSSSDAWRNATQALHFLAAFGHRFTEVFVVFGGTIHHAINLRKVPWTSLISARRGDPVSLEEPFVFRNQSVFADYMFKYIDGFYCNNFYPHKTQTYGDMTSPEYEDYKHRRWSWAAPKKRIGREEFDGGVRFVKVAPLMQPEELTTDTKLLVIEGYSSGTLPTEPTAEFARLLLSARANGVPVVLISDSGLLPTRIRYSETLTEDLIGRVIRLFGITRESALPLLSRLLASLAEGWSDPDGSGPNGGGMHLQDRRAALLVQMMERDFGNRRDILASVLGNIADEDDQQSNIKAQSDREHEASRDSQIQQRDMPIRPEDISLEPIERASGSILLRRDDLIQYLVRVQAAFDAPGAGSEAPALVSDTGYEWASKFMSRFLRSMPVPGAALFVELSPGEQRRLVAHVTECAAALERVLKNSGLVEVSISAFTQESLSDIRGQPWMTGIQTFVERKKARHFGRKDERYAMQGLDPDEAEWLARLRAGVPLMKEPNQFEREIEKAFNQRFEETWNFQTDLLDWFVLGLTRGITAAAVEHLRFDSWSRSCMRRGEKGRALLRESVVLSVVTGSKDLLEVRSSYQRRFEPGELPRLWSSADG